MKFDRGSPNSTNFGPSTALVLKVEVPPGGVAGIHRSRLGIRGNARQADIVTVKVDSCRIQDDRVVVEEGDVFVDVFIQLCCRHAVPCQTCLAVARLALFYNLKCLLHLLCGGRFGVAYRMTQRVRRAQVSA